MEPLKKENQDVTILAAPEEEALDFQALLVNHSALKAILATAQKVACADVNILITGERGTGKNVLAKAIHQASRQKDGPFVAVNCMAMPDTLIESELFGHEKGAFTDAHTMKRGSFEFADQGTLFLDEIGDMSAPAQGKILQAIEEKKIHRLGGEKIIPINIRLISATNRDLKKKMEEGIFREDLYYRLRGQKSAGLLISQISWRCFFLAILRYTVFFMDLAHGNFRKIFIVETPEEKSIDQYFLAGEHFQARPLPRGLPHQSPRERTLPR